MTAGISHLTERKLWMSERVEFLLTVANAS